MKPKTLMEVCKESMGEIKFSQKGDRFTMTGSIQWLEFFSGLVDEIKFEEATGKPIPKRTARRKAAEMEEQVFDIRPVKEGE